MKELAKEYKKSLKALNKRINDIVLLRIKLLAVTKSPAEDPEIIDLIDRLKPLRIMRKDLIEVTREVENYYVKGWWRSEKYTLNARKSRKFIYCEPIYNDTCNKPSSAGEDEAIPKYCDKIIIDGQTEASYRDVLH